MAMQLYFPVSFSAEAVFLNVFISPLYSRTYVCQFCVKWIFKKHRKYIVLLHTQHHFLFFSHILVLTMMWNTALLPQAGAAATVSTGCSGLPDILTGIRVPEASEIISETQLPASGESAASSASLFQEVLNGKQDVLLPVSGNSRL